VDEVFIPLGETLLIMHFKPLWNAVLDGFGNHPPGRGREAGKKPLWDVIHPGRAWAERLRASKTPDQAMELIANYLADFRLPTGEVTA
jgi:hypothetical protein